MPYPNTRPAPRNGPDHCPRCLTPIIWCVNAKQNTQAVDRERNPKGNQAVRQDHTGRWLSRQLAGDRPTPEGAEQLHMPHAATCFVPAPRTRRQPMRRRQGVRPIRQQR